MMARVILTMPIAVARELGGLLSHIDFDITELNLVNAELTGKFSTVDYEPEEIKIGFFSEEVKSSFWEGGNVAREIA